MSRLLRKLILVFLPLLLFIFICSCTLSEDISNGNGGTAKQETGSNIKTGGSGLLSVHYIDVGQADCIYIKAPGGKVMLIDAGNNGDSDTIIKYLKNQGVSKIDILVGTHPHEDHIGSMSEVIDTFDIGKFYMPKVTTTTKTYKDVINSAKSKNLSIDTASKGIILDLGQEVQAKMLAPVSSKYDELNDYSAVIKLVYKNTSFLFTGDAGEVSEKEMIKNKEDLSATVLKVGHHGSSTSTTSEFLNLVNPKYAVISVGKVNDYGHPAASTVNRLEKKGIKIFRTDESGTIIAASDGNNVKFNK